MSTRLLFVASALLCANYASAQCSFKGLPSGLTTREGFVEFMPAAKLNPLKAALPETESNELNQVLTSPDTMWYDDEHIVFLYQDSVETVVGGRANCVGRVVGETNGYPISKLKNLFGPDYRFKFPFRQAAGTDNTTNVYTINFWVPARRDGKALPVKWWQNPSDEGRANRGRWNWVFPNGTLFGEVLYQRAPDGKMYVFEIRTRKRYLQGWEVNLFRPYTSANQLADAIEQKRPDWNSNFNLANVIAHLRNSNNLVAKSMISEAYGSVFESINGALDLIPEINDKSLVAELLTTKMFVSTEGAIWKEGNGKETYAPGSAGEFSVVPKGYEMGLIPVNEVSCNRCHIETGRQLKFFDWDVQLYGEIWGEDRIFTWHLFQPNRQIFQTFDDSDGSRIVNPRMVQANLLSKGKPSSSDPDYRQLPTPF